MSTTTAIGREEKACTMKWKRRCAVPGCSSNRDSLSFIFPRNEEMGSRWLDAINNDTLKKFPYLELYKAYNCVCYRHFPPEAIYKTGNGTRRLLKNYIPMLNLPITQPTKSTTKTETIESLTEITADKVQDIDPIKNDHLYCLSLTCKVQLPGAATDTVLDIDLSEKDDSSSCTYNTILDKINSCNIDILTYSGSQRPITPLLPSSVSYDSSESPRLSSSYDRETGEIFSTNQELDILNSEAFEFIGENENLDGLNINIPTIEALEEGEHIDEPIQIDPLASVKTKTKKKKAFNKLTVVSEMVLLKEEIVRLKTQNVAIQEENASLKKRLNNVNRKLRRSIAARKAQKEQLKKMNRAKRSSEKLKNMHNEDGNGIRKIYTYEEKLLALSIYKKNHGAYRMQRSFLKGGSLKLPSVSTLKGFQREMQGNTNTDFSIETSLLEFTKNLPS